MMPNRLLVLDASGPVARAALFDGDVAVAVRADNGARGPAAVVPALVRAVLAGQERPDAVAAIVGPGGFTGLRAALAFAQGVADGRGIPAIAVTAPEALGVGQPLGRTLWCVQTARSNLVYLTRDDATVTLPLDALPMPDGPIAVAGDAAPRGAAALAARGADVRLSDARYPAPAAIASVARARVAGLVAPRAFIPLYAEPPLVRPARVRPTPA